jgi:hypothetical protein
MSGTFAFSYVSARMQKSGDEDARRLGEKGIVRRVGEEGDVVCEKEGRRQKILVQGYEVRNVLDCFQWPGGLRVSNGLFVY